MSALMHHRHSAMASVAHPLIAQVPRFVAPLARAFRWLALSQLRAGWRGSPIELTLPDNKRIVVGDAGHGVAARARIHDDRFFTRLLLRGEMGAGEAFVADEWSADDLVGVLRVFLRAQVESPLTRLAQLPELWRHRRAANTQRGSERNIHAHYDLGNAFYELFLDEDTLAYSCGIYPAPSLADAQRAKFEALCNALDLRAEDHLLEIGCGWGGMAIHAARTRGCRVTAITVSREQQRLARERVAQAGLADRVTIEYRDYRDLDDATTYDKIVSIEMLEAVGFEFLRGYFATCQRALAPGGKLAIQSITMPDERFSTYRTRVDWMQTYVFPGSLIPSLGAIRDAAGASGLTIDQATDIGPSYADTLRAWRETFLARLPEVRALGFDEPFIRTWLLYLAFSEAAFAERTLRVHHLVLTGA